MVVVAGWGGLLLTLCVLTVSKKGFVWSSSPNTPLLLIVCVVVWRGVEPLRGNQMMFCVGEKKVGGEKMRQSLTLDL